MDVETLVIIQARMGSRRLPGKALLKLEGKPLIQHTMERALEAKNVDEVVLAISDTPEDEPLEGLCKKKGFKCSRGPLKDVLSRFILAASPYHPKLVVRICGDEPLLDPWIVEQAVQKHIAAKAEYSTTAGQVPKGLDVEVINFETLRDLDSKTKSAEQREHVTKYILDNPSGFNIQKLDFGKGVARPDIVLTVDTQSDLEFVTRVHAALKGKARNIAKAIISLVDSQEVKRKPCILLRADGSNQKGMGDLVVMMNICKHLEGVFEPVFATRDYIEGIEFIKERGFEVIELPKAATNSVEVNQVIALCEKRNVKHAIVELVPPDEEYVKILSKKVKTLMVDDGENPLEVYSDIYLCWNLSPARPKFPLLLTEKLIGPRYVPIDLHTKPKLHHSPRLRWITITMGGSDPDSVSARLLHFFSGKGYEITVVVGPGFSNKAELLALAKKEKFKIISAPKELAPICTASDVVICAGGLTCLELSALGVPFIGISMRPWEVKRLSALEEIGACMFLLLDSNLEKDLLKSLTKLEGKKVREGMGVKGMSIIDGNGAKRITETIKARWAG